jgi:hypothetical protein
LFFLWGDLEEIKGKEPDPAVQLRPSNRPFYCCIAEYGAQDTEADGEPSWIRCHKMIYTTISTE